MTREQHTIFPITIIYQDGKFETKAIKYRYANKEVLYKIALPSTVSPVQQLWVSKNNTQWKQIMGPEANGALLLEIINAIEKHERVPMIKSTTTVDQLGLRSA